MVDWEIVKKLIQMVKEEDITGLAIEEKGVKYEVRREKGQLANVPPAVTSVPPSETKEETSEEEG
ncbi:MAG: hypothetical protein ACPL4K_01985, partial [Candidatus Margulisiibacteriota bacterium]